MNEEGAWKAVKGNSMKIVNIVFLCNYILLQICAVFFVRKLHFQSVLLGIYLFGLCAAMEFLEIVQPQNVIKNVRVWKFRTARGVVLCFLSIVAMDGQFITGVLSLIISFTILISCVFTGEDLAPRPLLPLQEALPEKTPLVVVENVLMETVKSTTAQEFEVL